MIEIVDEDVEDRDDQGWLCGIIKLINIYFDKYFFKRGARKELQWRVSPTFEKPKLYFTNKFVLFIRTKKSCGLCNLNQRREDETKDFDKSQVSMDLWMSNHVIACDYK